MDIFNIVVGVFTILGTISSTIAAIALINLNNKTNINGNNNKSEVNQQINKGKYNSNTMN